MLEPDVLVPLLADANPAVTIYCATERTETNAAAPEATARQLLGEAEAMMAEYGADAARREAVLAPVRDALTETRFNEHRENGLVFFAAEGSCTPLWLPERMQSGVSVGRLFNLRPLIPFLTRNRRFWILALSAGRVRLLSATPFGSEEVELELTDLNAAAEADSQAANTGSAEDIREELLVQDMHRVADAVRARIGDDPAPLVLIAEPRRAGHFGKLAGLRQMLHQAVHANPFAFSDDELLARAMGVIAPMLDSELATVLDQAAARLGTAEPSVAIRLEEILAAAHEGRVDAVVIAEGEHLWGRFDVDRREVKAAHGTPAAGDEDLLNEAVVLTLRNSGRAYVAPRERLPRGVAAVANYRY